VAGALSLPKYRSASRWQPLIWFWTFVLSIAAVLGVVLTLLGPPSERISAPRPTQNVAQAPKPLPANMPPQVARVIEAERLREASAPMQSAPNQARSLTPGLQAPGDPTRGQPAMAAQAAGPVEAERPRATPAPVWPEPGQPAPSIAGFRALGGVAQPDAPSRSRAILVLHPARPEGSAAIASRLAAQVGLAPDQVDIGTVAEARSEAIIRFYSASDHSLARRLGNELARMGYSWRIDNVAGRSTASKDQAVEVYLPAR
jgi:hypothetical protein